MTRAHHRRNRLALWYESTSHPGLILAAVVFLLYGHTLLGGFMIDDHRNLRLMAEYHAGQRDSLDLYRFLAGGESNRQAREAGWFPWWVGDDLHYQHFRIVSERLLYAEYLLFGDRAVWFHLVGLALYALGVRLVLGLFRLISGDERQSRWSALIFAVAGCHAIPVAFVAGHCDVFALVPAVGAMLLAGRYVRDAGIRRMAPACVLFALALGSKEAVLPMAILPACFGFALVFRGKRGAGRRAGLAVGVFLILGFVWLGFYVAGGYGSNASLMLDPLHAPLDYLDALPGRAILLLSTWFMPVNPFLFLFKQGWHDLIFVYGGIGVVGLVVLAILYGRRYRSRRGVAAMAIWVLLFIPLLACTLPDDRVMVLPSVGFAFLAGVWLTHPWRDGSKRLRRIPLVLFVLLQGSTAWISSAFMGFLEYEANRHLAVVVSELGPEVAELDGVFFLNTARSFEALFLQDRFRRRTGEEDVRVGVLSDIAHPTVQVVDARTLRLESGESPFFSSFVGLMGTSRGHAKQEGEVFEAGLFEGKIMKVENGAVRAVELRFRKPIASGAYRFFWSDLTGPPVEYSFERMKDEKGAWSVPDRFLTGAALINDRSDQ